MMNHMQIENRMVVASEWPQNNKTFMTCGCGGDIFEGEEYWNIHGDIVCQECIKDYLRDFRKVAE